MAIRNMGKVARFCECGQINEKAGQPRTTFADTGCARCRRAQANTRSVRRRGTARPDAERCERLNAAAVSRACDAWLRARGLGPETFNA